jgi:signal transduction histidine kinase
MTEQGQGGREQAISRALAELGLPALAFTLGVGFATGDWPASLGTGPVISSAIAGLYWLDRRFLRPRMEQLSRDWLRLGLEMTTLLLDHVLGAVAALLICSRIFGFEVIPTAAWLAVAAMVVAFPIIHGTEMALRFFRQVQEKERQEEQLRALAAEAELKALKAQINPHFLFNTLNTIAELIHADSERAENTVERLAEMFRYVLNGSERGLVPLEEELAFLDDYLEIERVRFGDRLRVTRAIAPHALGVLVPSLVLQPMVENAVRHGQAADGSADLGIDIHTDGDLAVIAISDHGPGMPPQHKIGESAGHGLYNVDQRLRKTYGEAYGLKICANQPQGTIVTLRIPVSGTLNTGSGTRKTGGGWRQSR